MNKSIGGMEEVGVTLKEIIQYKTKTREREG